MAQPVTEAAHGKPDQPLRVGLAFGVLAAAIVIGLLMGLEVGPRGTVQGEDLPREFIGGFNGIGALVVGSLTLFLGWALSGRWLMSPLGDSLRRNRVGIHTWTSMAALAMVFLHTFGLLAMEDTRGWLSGTGSTVLMVALFVTGWWRPYYVKAWGLKTWRWIHWELALGALALGFEHWILIEHAKEAARHAAGA